MTRPYRPSNGTEGMSFMDSFCFNGCKHETKEKPCQIMGRSLGYSIGDPEYPKEWIQEDDGSRPRCTAYQEIGSDPATPRCDKTEDMFS